MRSLLVLILLAIVSGNEVNGQIMQDKKVQKYLLQKKYESAFQYLQELDPGNNDVDIFLMKMNIASEFYVKSFNYRKFSFMDLAKFENLEVMRKVSEVEDLPIYYFAPDKILDSLIQKNPKDLRLHRSKGDLYVKIIEMYGSDWFMSESRMREAIFLCYKEIQESKLATDETQYVLAQLQHDRGDFEESEVTVKRCIKMNERHVKGNILLSKLYKYREVHEKALSHANRAFLNTYDIEDKKIATTLAGEIYIELKKYPEAEKDLLEGLALDSKYEPALYQLIRLKMLTNEKAQAFEYGERFLELAPEYHDHVKGLIYLLNEYGKYTWIEEFMFDQLNNYIFKPEVQGNLYIVLADFYQSQGKSEEAHKCLTDALSAYKKAPQPDTNILGNLESRLNNF